MEEKDLVAKAAGGDKEAFMELYRRYREMVYRHCYAVTLNVDAARDLFQEVWLKIFVGLRRIQKVESFAGYVKAILRNTITDYFRKVSHNVQAETDPDILKAEDRDLISALDAQKLLKRLSPEDGYLLFLRFYEGYTVKEISSIFGISESAIKMRLHRILKRLGENCE